MGSGEGDRTAAARAKIVRIWTVWLVAMVALGGLIWVVALVPLPGGSSEVLSPVDALRFLVHIGVSGTLMFLLVLLGPPLLLTYFALRPMGAMSEIERFFREVTDALRQRRQ